jgi:hypothetical protein
MEDGKYERKPVFRIISSGEPGSIEVTNIDTGEIEFRPDIAARALGVFGSAIEKAGGEFEVPDDISSLFSEEVRGITPPDDVA